VLLSAGDLRRSGSAQRRDQRRNPALFHVIKAQLAALVRPPGEYLQSYAFQNLCLSDFYGFSCCCVLLIARDPCSSGSVQLQNQGAPSRHRSPVAAVQWASRRGPANTVLDKGICAVPVPPSSGIKADPTLLCAMEARLAAIIRPQEDQTAERAVSSGTLQLPSQKKT
jgi:hypothetical protein